MRCVLYEIESKCRLTRVARVSNLSPNELQEWEEKKVERGKEGEGLVSLAKTQDQSNKIS